MGPLVSGCNELWGFVGKKQQRLKPGDGADKGDQYVFVALDGVVQKVPFPGNTGNR